METTINQIIAAVNSRLNLDESVVIETPFLSLNVTKKKASSLNGIQTQGSSMIELPSFCELTNSKPILINISNPTYTPLLNPNDCNSRQLTIVVSFDLKL